MFTALSADLTITATETYTDSIRMDAAGVTLTNLGAITLNGSNTAVYSLTNGGYTVENQGTLSVTSSSTGWGVRLLGEGNTIDNSGDVTISSQTDAYGLNATHIVNSGHVTVACTYAFNTSSQSAAVWFGSSLENSGTLSASATGQQWAFGVIAVDVYAGGIVNYGTIDAQIDGARTAKAIGIDVSFSTYFVVSAPNIVNEGEITAGIAINSHSYSSLYASVDWVANVGTITGDVLLAGGNDRIENGGSIVGVVDMGDGDDYVASVGGHIDGPIRLGAGADTCIGGSSLDNAQGGTGNDLIRGSGGADRLGGGSGTDRLYGGVGADFLAGGSGADVLVGEAGKDTIDGGAGRDTLRGGEGADVFVFGTKPAAFNVDAIADYNPASDSFWLMDSVFELGTGVLDASEFTTGTAATAATHRIVYDDQTGALYYDADGTGAAAQIQIASLAAGLVLSSADFIGHHG